MSFDCLLANAPFTYYNTEIDRHMGAILNGEPLFYDQDEEHLHLDTSRESTYDSSGTYVEQLNSPSALSNTDFFDDRLNSPAQIDLSQR